MQVCDVLRAVEADGVKLKELRVDGGMTANSLLMQMQADLLDTHILRADMPESTALGAAIAATIGAKIHRNLAAIKALGFATYTTFEPSMGADVRGRMQRRWEDAIQRSFNLSRL